MWGGPTAGLDGNMLEKRCKPVTQSELCGAGFATLFWKPRLPAWNSRFTPMVSRRIGEPGQVHGRVA